MLVCDLQTIKIVQGDTKRIVHTLTDSQGNKLTNLASLSDVVFMAKTNGTDADVDAKITLKKTLGQITVDEANSTLTLIFEKNTTVNLSPQELIPFCKLLYQSLSEQYHLDMYTDKGQSWTVLEIVESGIDESIS